MLKWLWYSNVEVIRYLSDHRVLLSHPAFGICIAHYADIRVV